MDKHHAGEKSSGLRFIRTGKKFSSLIDPSNDSSTPDISFDRSSDSYIKAPYSSSDHLKIPFDDDASLLLSPTSFGHSSSSEVIPFSNVHFIAELADANDKACDDGSEDGLEQGDQLTEVDVRPSVEELDYKEASSGVANADHTIFKRGTSLSDAGSDNHIEEVEESIASHVSNFSQHYTSSFEPPDLNRQTTSDRDTSESSAALFAGENEYCHQSSKGRATAAPVCIDAKVQTDESLCCAWNGHATPAIGPQHMLLQQTTIDVFTAHSQLALTNMLQHQLRLTKEIVNAGQQLYHNYSQEKQNPQDFQYTTVDKTLSYISRNKPSVVSYENALASVEADQQHCK